MKIFLVIAAALLMSGCAYWDKMTPEQQQLTIAAAVVGLVVGYNSSDGETVYVEVPVPTPQHCKGKC